MKSFFALALSEAPTTSQILLLVYEISIYLLLIYSLKVVPLPALYLVIFIKQGSKIFSF